MPLNQLGSYSLMMAPPERLGHVVLLPQPAGDGVGRLPELVDTRLGDSGGGGGDGCRGRRAARAGGGGSGLELEAHGGGIG